MERISLDLRSRASESNLGRFLESLQDEARDDRHFKLLSICLKVRHVDALAVLDSIYEAGAEHFYLEQPSHNWAMAGAEAIWEASFSGMERFRQMQESCQDVLEHSVAVGDVDHVMTGPHFFTAFAFEPETVSGVPFPPAHVFVPQWAVARDGAAYYAIANCRVEVDTDVQLLARRIWAAHEKFNKFDYGKPPEPPSYKIREIRETGPDNAFPDRVQRALDRISDGRYQKIVLSRACDIEFSANCQPLQLLNNLRERFRNCHLFSIQNNQSESYIGASPERLIQVREGRFFTEAIAGSEPRGADAREDAALAGALLKSDKDLREHQLVIDSIRRRLDEMGISVDIAAEPELLQLANVQHLHTPISGKLPGNCHLLDLASVLHPTPAVGGSPRKSALEDITAWEPYPRNLYAGLVGWFGPEGDGDLVVGLRSAWVHDNFARLYAGAGIVAGSDPQKELRETNFKMAALLDAMRAARGEV